jgi:hypothetical protein
MSDDMERDDALQETLRTWRAPAVSNALDERVMASYRRTFPGRGPRRWKFWAPAVLATSAIALLLLSTARPSRSLELDSTLDGANSSTSYVTRVNASGFVAVPDGKIVVTKVGEPQ